MYQNKSNKKNILVAPLNWGLGHATRCIPIIKSLMKCGYNPIIASDGASLLLLKKEFPALLTLELPDYKIEYPKNGSFFKLKMIQNLPNTIIAVYKEKQIIRKWVDKYNIVGIISDNRFGVFSNKIPSIYITHQINVLSGNSTRISSFFHQKIIQNFDQCWVPDYENNNNLSGILGHLTDKPTRFLKPCRYIFCKTNKVKKRPCRIKYIGILSRFEKTNLPQKYNLMILLSGPESQRSILENKLMNEIKNYSGNIIFVKGIVENEQKTVQKETTLFYNFMTSSQLQQAFNESEMVLCRAGYTTIMDLVKLEKKAFLIPTVGQFEQEYLAKKMCKEGVFPTSNQDDFKIEMLTTINQYNNISMLENDIDWQELFSIFEVEKG